MLDAFDKSLIDRYKLDKFIYENPEYTTWMKEAVSGVKKFGSINEYHQPILSIAVMILKKSEKLFSHVNKIQLDLSQSDGKDLNSDRWGEICKTAAKWLFWICTKEDKGDSSKQTKKG